MKIVSKKAGIIIIGNEILNGKTVEKNSNFLCKKLALKGISVKEISIIPDTEREIIKKIKNFKKKFDFVFTTGGIGPTHDDITSKCVAKALGVKYSLNRKANNLLSEHYSDENYTKARKKMAYLPHSCKLINNPVSVAPGFSIENIYVFPGVPNILKVMLVEFLKNIDDSTPVIQKTISTILSEGIIGEFVSKTQKKFPKIEIGSYPYFKKNSFGVSLVLRGYSEEELMVVTNIIFNYLKKENGKPKLF